MVVRVVAEGKPQVPAALTPTPTSAAFVLCLFNSVVPFVVHERVVVVAGRARLRVEVTATVPAAAGAPTCMLWVALLLCGSIQM